MRSFLNNVLVAFSNIARIERNLYKQKNHVYTGEHMTEIIHVKVSNGNTQTLPIPLDRILKSKMIPDELDIVIDKKPQEYIEEVLGCFDFDDETLEEVNQLEMKQWLSD